MTKYILIDIFKNLCITLLNNGMPVNLLLIAVSETTIFVGEAIIWLPHINLKSIIDRGSTLTRTF